MIIENLKIKKLLFTISVLILLICSNSFAAKYTIASGKDFNNRIKMHISKNYTSATPDYTLTAFKYSNKIEGTPIDISEDGDSSALAYIKNNILYCVSDDDVYINEDASYMFDKFVNLKQVDLSFLNLKKLNKTKFMFGNCKYLTNIDFDNDTTIYLNELEGMFFDCQSLVDLNIFMFNTKNVRNMNSLFYNCKNLKNIMINPSLWSIKNVTNFDKMYFNCQLLKTNFNKLATSIPESEYKIYTKAGDDDIEGLLKDYDFDYDDYGKNTGSIKVDKLTDKLITSTENTNTFNNINTNELQNSFYKSEVKISTTSDLYEHHSEAKIDKYGRLKLSDNILSKALKELPISN